MVNILFYCRRRTVSAATIVPSPAYRAAQFLQELVPGGRNVVFYPQIAPISADYGGRSCCCAALHAAGRKARRFFLTRRREGANLSGRTGVSALLFFSREGATTRRRRMASCLAASRRCTPPVERREDFISREGAKARICRGGLMCPPFVGGRWLHKLGKLSLFSWLYGLYGTMLCSRAGCQTADAGRV